MLGRWIEIILVEKGKVAPSHVYLVSASLSSAGDVWCSLLPFQANINSVKGVCSSPLSSHSPSFRTSDGVALRDLLAPERASCMRVKLLINVKM